MLSDRKRAANRFNATRSTGPRTALGKLHTRRNAFRHGLAIGIVSSPALLEEIVWLAKIIDGDSGNPQRFEQAAIVAETEFDLIRIRAARVAILEQAAPRSTSSAPSVAFARDLVEILPQLLPINRYERRALSRRKRAIRQLQQYHTQ